MSARTTSSDLGFRVADRLRLEGPWDLVGERARRFEVHLQGSSIELERGPISIEGYGLRVFRPHGDGLGVGFQASTDLTSGGVEAVVADAERMARYAEFPARSVQLPAAGAPPAEVPVVDPKLWAEPAAAVRTYVQELLGAFDGRTGVAPTFGSVKAVLSELTIANSAGLRASFPATAVELELGVKAFGGPEGRPPGEYWVTDFGRRLDPAGTVRSVDDWCRYAADARRSVSPPSGELPVVVPPETSAGILPAVLGFRLSGAARLRQIAPAVGSRIAAEGVSVRDEGDYPWSFGAAPYDDEGTPRSRRALVDRGVVANLLYDTLYGAAFSTPSTGSGVRHGLAPGAGLRFTYRPSPDVSTLVVQAGAGGTTAELVETAGEGILLTQLGWASPNPISGRFGGEIRIGYRIRGGKVAEPVRGGTVGGVVFGPEGSPSMLANVVSVGREPELHGQVAAPPLLVRPLAVAGAT